VRGDAAKNLAEPVQASRNQFSTGSKSMNNDRAEGKTKDVVGRVERQVGEWTGSKEKQADGTARQASGKVQNAWGKAKDAASNVLNKAGDSKPPQRAEDDTETEESVNARRSRS